MTPALPMRCPDCRGCALYEEHAAGRAEPLAHAGMVLDARTSTIRHGGREVGVTRTHSRILAALLRVPGRPVTFEVLRIAAGGEGADGGLSSDSLRTHLSQIRRDVIRRHGLPLAIEARKDVGYVALVPA